MSPYDRSHMISYLTFYSNYGSISCRFWDMQCRKMSWPWNRGQRSPKVRFWDIRLVSNNSAKKPCHSRSSKIIPFNPGTLKREKMLFWDLVPPRYKIPEFFTIASVLVLWRFASEIAVIPVRHLYIGLRVRYKYYKNSRSGLVWSHPCAVRDLSRHTSVFRTTIGVCKMLSISV